MVITDYAKLRMVDLFRKTDALSMYDDFLESQWFSPEKISVLQWNRLKDLLVHAYKNVPYYYRVFNEAGIKPELVNSIEDFRRIPILTKEVIRVKGKDLVATNAKKFRPRRKKTGGSTGEPLQYLLDHKSHSALWAFIFRSWHTGGWNPGDRVVILGGGSLFPNFSSFKRKIYAYMNNWLALSCFDVSEDTLMYWVKRIRKFNAKYMYAYASSAYLLANFMKYNKMKDISFNAVFTTAEVLHPHFRKTIEEVFGCEVYNTYGGADGAGYAYECEEHAGLHIVSENAIVEILKEDGNSASEEQEGEIVTTDLYNYAMPFIRYKVEDIGTLTHARCPCGRGLPLLKDIRGRSSDYIVTKKGSKVHSAFFGYLFRECDIIQQYLVVQENQNDIHIYLKPTAFLPNHNGKLDELKRVVSNKLQDMNIQFILTDEIPRSPNGKFKSVINKIRLL